MHAQPMRCAKLLTPQSALLVLRNHTLDLRTAPPTKPTRHFALLLELVLDQHRLHPAIHLPAVFTLKTEPFTGCYQLANLLQTQLLGCVHTNIQSSASPILQPHLVLESS